jgi:26S proteasome regulatory subunit T5
MLLQTIYSQIIFLENVGTGKTMLARAVAAQTKSTFLKLAGPQLVQMFIGDGAKLVRDAFALAKEKAPAIIFIDELDAIGKTIRLPFTYIR